MKRKSIEQLREEHNQLDKLLTTATTLDKYMGRVLKDRKLCAGECAYLMEETFGEEIHDMIAGFIKFANCLTTDLEPNDIRICLAHDLGGALNRDTMMLPRCSQYAKYTMLEEGESVEDFIAEEKSQEQFLHKKGSWDEIDRKVKGMIKDNPKLDKAIKEVDRESNV